MMKRRLSSLGLALAFLASVEAASLLPWQPRSTATAQESAHDHHSSALGHHAHGAPSTEGPHTRPRRIEGIGKVHFPITTSVPEAQEWFDQGVALLHSFWFFEAERAFRWCLKLDPDAVMAYWGLAQVRLNWLAVTYIPRDGRCDRCYAFLAEAAKGKDRVSRRERLYIEAWEDAFAIDPSNDTGGQFEEWGRRFKVLADRLELIVLEYPEDLEAKAFMVLYSLPPYEHSSNRYGNALVLREILQQAPGHPGAHHYMLHNWDSPQGEQALDSARLYGEVAPGVAHAHHMAGHVYSDLGMWHEGAISMHRASEVDLRYLRQYRVFPFTSFLYAHHHNYLAYMQEQLGMAEAAIQDARRLLAAPLDPQHNNPDKLGEWVHREGLSVLVRALVKFERWQDVLEPGFIPWRNTVQDRIWRSYGEALAHLGLGRLHEARQSLEELTAYSDEADAPEHAWFLFHYPYQRREVEALLRLAQGDEREGLELLREAAELELESRRFANDPSYYPRVLYTVLGEVYLERGTPQLAREAFETTLSVMRNDGFALSGLARAQVALGDRQGAIESYGRLLHVWSGADPGLRWMEAVKRLGLTAEPIDRSPVEQRSYSEMARTVLGPLDWQPFDAPRLEARGPAGEPVTLEQFRGQHLVLVFLEDAHGGAGAAQLQALAARGRELEELGATVLAVVQRPAARAAPPHGDLHSDLRSLGSLPFTLASDDGDHSNARRFQSYDDFTGVPLSSISWIDRRGKLRWARTGSLLQLDTLMAEIRRADATTPAARSASDVQSPSPVEAPPVEAPPAGAPPAGAPTAGSPVGAHGPG